MLLKKKHPESDNVRQSLQRLNSKWNELLQASNNRGKGLVELKDILMFNEQVDKVEMWIREKVRLIIEEHNCIFVFKSEYQYFTVIWFFFLWIYSSFMLLVNTQQVIKAFWYFSTLIIKLFSITGSSSECRRHGKGLRTLSGAAEEGQWPWISCK